MPHPWAPLLIVFILGSPEGAAASSNPPLQDGPSAVAEKIHWAVRQFQQAAPAIGIQESSTMPLSTCNAVSPALADCDAHRFAPCQQSLADAFTRSAKMRDGDAPALNRATAARLTAELAEALHSIHSVQRAFREGSCDSLITAGVIPAQLRLLGDGRTLRLRPIRPLRMGRRYTLEAEGISPKMRTLLKGTLYPRALDNKVELPTSAFSLPLVRSFPTEINSIDLVDATRLLRRLESSLSQGDFAGTATVPGLQAVWPLPLQASDLIPLEFRFVPAAQSSIETALLTFRTREDRAALHEKRETLRAQACPTTPLTPANSGDALGWPNFRGELYRGELRSIRATVNDSTFPASPKVPFLLALPRGFSQATPLVLLVHGHKSRGARMLAKHFLDLIPRGMAALAIDLPDHGSRGGTGENFFTPQDPAALALHLRQSAVDAMATIDVALRCGFQQPNTWNWKPREVLYLGYSVGSIVGLILRSVEPNVGTSVFLAAGADLSAWLNLQASLSFGPNLVSCLGGPDNGRDCLADPTCESPGICGPDPLAFQLAENFALPFGWTIANAEPLAYAHERTGTRSSADLLLITGGLDYTFSPQMAARLGDALGLKVVTPHLRVGPGGRHLQYPELGHDLREDPKVRLEAALFLASRGRQRPGIAFPLPSQQKREP